jgi:site-specific DNA recombinase
MRQDLLDELVWREIVMLLENPSLIQAELDRRLAAARNANPTKHREEVLRREIARIQKSTERLMTAYQEDLLSLDDLRRRMPELRKREKASHAELHSMVNQVADREAYLRLAETLTSFLTRLRSASKTLDVEQRQHIVRLLVKEILVADDTIVIRHSIPTLNNSPIGGGTSSSSNGRQIADAGGYLLRKGSQDPTLRRPPFPPDEAPIRHPHRCLQPSLDVHQHPRAIRMFTHRPHEQICIDAVEEGLDIKIKNPGMAPASLPRHTDRIERRFAGPGIRRNPYGTEAPQGVPGTV